VNKVMLIFGHGYSAGVLSGQLLADGWRVIGTTRSGGKLAETGVEEIVWSGKNTPDSLISVLPEVTHILVSVAPGPKGDGVLAQFGAEICAAAPSIRWLGYLSTTAVYGDHQGGDVDETTPLDPATDRGRWRAKAEGDWTKLADKCGLPLHIFRLAGIYGPARGPFAKVRAGTARRIIKAGQVFSRIHVEDIAQVLRASIINPAPGAIYNVCDDLAAPPQDVIGYAAELLHLPLPEAVPYEIAEMTPMARSFYAESKRVLNWRIKRDLGVSLLYPTYHEGLKALLAQEQQA